MLAMGVLTRQLVAVEELFAINHNIGEGWVSHQTSITGVDGYGGYSTIIYYLLLLTKKELSNVMHTFLISFTATRGSVGLYVF